MEYIALGKNGTIVSRLCFGSLTLSPLQANFSAERGADVISCAIQRGVNFVDTAQYYRNYGQIARAMKKSGKFDLVISTKTYAYTRELAEAAFEEARIALDRDYIDIFMLHEQESEHTLRGHADALEFLFEMREKGLIKNVGVSTHHISAIHGVCGSDWVFDCIHPIYNMRGLGIADGTLEEMENAIALAKNNRIGIFSMKALGGGNLYSSAEEALKFVLSNKNIDSIAIGMQSIDEIDANISFFETHSFTEKQQTLLESKKRTLHIEDYCDGCGKCVKRCGINALSLQNSTAVCDKKRCVLCGYCSSVCPHFAIKII